MQKNGITQLHAAALQISFTGTKISKPVPACQYPCAPHEVQEDMIWLQRNNLSGLDRALTSTPLNTFEINWTADCAPDLLTNALMAQCAQIPIAMC